MQFLNSKRGWFFLAAAVAALGVVLRLRLGGPVSASPGDQLESPQVRGQTPLEMGGGAEEHRVSAFVEDSGVQGEKLAEVQDPSPEGASSEETSSPGYVPLTVGIPVLPAFPGDSYWVQYYERYGDMTPEEYSEVFDAEAGVLQRMMLDYAKEQASYGAFYRYEPGEGGFVDPALYELLKGPDYPLIVYQTVEGIGQTIVLLPKDTYPDLYEKYYETCWLNSAIEGTPWHDPRYFDSFPDPYREKK